MGIKDYINKKKQEFDEWEEKYEEKKKNEKELRIQEKLSKYDIFKGISVTATFPQKELRLKSHSGATRGLATLGFGVVGLAATNNVKQEKENVVLDTVFQIVEKGIVFKNAANDGKDLRIPYENIVDASYNRVCGSSYKINVDIRLLENQFIKFIPTNISTREIIGTICSSIVETVNERAKGSQYEEEGWGIEHTENNQSMKKSQNESNETSTVDELEKIMNMYKEGLLTDEEFAIIKKKIIER